MDWADLLPYAEVAYNNAVHNSTGFTPFQIVSGREFIPIPECPRIDPVNMGVKEWSDQMRNIWGSVKVYSKLHINICTLYVVLNLKE